MIKLSPCKINIGLFIKKRRNDGYHELESIFYPIPWNDILEIVPSERFSFTSKGLNIPGLEEDNLCIKAYHLLKNKYSLPPVNIYLHKNIPMGAGLGGGSSNAAYTILILNELFNLKLNKATMQNLALELGSDCPFFIENQAKLIRGRGEKMKKINLKISKYYIHFIFPNIHISTKKAFSSIIPNNKRTFQSNIEVFSDLNKWKQFYINDFETFAISKYPELIKITQKTYNSGAIYSSMTGSGSCFYALYDKKPNFLFTDNKNYLEKIIYLP